MLSALLGYGTGDGGDQVVKESTPAESATAPDPPDANPEVVAREETAEPVEPVGHKENNPVDVELSPEQSAASPVGGSSTMGDDKENTAPEPKPTLKEASTDGSATDADDTDNKSSPSTTIGLSKTRTKSSSETYKNVKRFSDLGESGFYDGQLNDAGQRHGQGKMIYDSGNTYEGPFVNDKFQGEHGIYRWFDGDEQEGSWLEGERHGASIFRSALDGSVEYSNYITGKADGEGVWWSADRTKAHTLTGGLKMAEISLSMAENLAEETFSLSVPEPSKIEPSQLAVAAVAVPATSSGRSVGILGRLFSSRAVGPDGKPMFKEHGEWGTYDGNVDADGNRQGQGKMIYESGNYYEGEFMDDKFHGDKGLYHWNDGDEYVGDWKDGERHGVGIFRLADGSVEYSMYDMGAPKDGVTWSPDCKTVHKTLNGAKAAEMLAEEAESFVKETFGLPVPEPSDISSKPDAAVSSPSKSAGLLGRLFPNKKVSKDGKPMFKDYGEWGIYEGEVDANGNRQGQGKITYDSTNYYEGEFMDDKFHGDKGLYHWNDGDEYEGSWKDGERHGVGIFRLADGSVEYSMYDTGASNNGVTWSPDRKTVHKTLNGTKKSEMLAEEAESFVKETFGLPVPEPSDISSKPDAAVSSPSKSAGLLGRLLSNKKFSKDGKPMFKDYGEWGIYEGEVDADGNRQGQGKMTYDSTNYYEGGFNDNQFHGDKGLYHWNDGDEYEGSWKDGERHGIGIFRLADGSVDYSNYDKGSHTGDGVAWSPDRKTAHKTLAGKKKSEVSAGMAEKLGKDMFDLPVPEPSTTAPSQAAAASSPKHNDAGFFRRLFSVKKVGPDGKPMFKDYGEWGSYEGDVDADGNRQGKGKMTYGSGNYYDGEFKDDMFHGDKGMYSWIDGDSYDGMWKDGERYGVGNFRQADGAVEYSMFEAGTSKGEGVWWSPDRKTAYTLLDGEKKIEILITEAVAISKEKFDLPIPEASTNVVSPAHATVPAKSLLGRLFGSKEDSAVGPDGKMRYKDNADWGSYEGEFDTTGKLRNGQGKTTYDSGNYYEGAFIDNKYHGDKGVYSWADGDSYEGQWSEGERNGIGIFRFANGSVEYSMYENGGAVSEGVSWSADRKTAHKIIEGEKKHEISLALAEKFAKEKFDLAVPAPSTTSASSQPEPKPAWRIFRSKENDSTAKKEPRFEDYGDIGTYDGELVNELRQGEGKMLYDSGNSYEGDFSNDKFDGNRGLYRWADGTEYEGSWKEGVFDGIGIYRVSNEGVDYSMYKDGYAAGVGVAWNVDFTKAFHTLVGVVMGEISLADAEKLAKNKFGLPVPSAASSSSSRSMGLLGRLFSPRVDSNGKPMFKDYFEWGSYTGGLNSSGKRHGQGKMTYESGNYYEGGFKDDKFHGEKGVYHWNDGDEYEGSWKDGERHGIGIFRTSDGTVDYSIYDRGSHTGEGVTWSPDRETAHKMLDGAKKAEMLIEEAESFAKEKFDLPAPEPSDVSTKSTAVCVSPSSKVGLFARLFSNKKIGPDGKPMFKDYGEWGSYEGDVDADGNRHGKGKMTYESGNYYEGGFANNKFHGDKGLYHWNDGDEYVGDWKAGERHGVGSFRLADGSVEYSMYKNGIPCGAGCKLSSDRKTAHSLVDGSENMEMLIEEAETLVKEKFSTMVI